MLDDGQQAQSVGSREPTHGGDCNTLGPFGFRACIGLPEAKPISHLERQIQGDRCTVCILALITIACGPMDCNPTQERLFRSGEFPVAASAAELTFR